MPLYLRQLRLPQRWASFVETFDFSKKECPHDCLAMAIDGRGTSVYEVNNVNEQLRVAAALTLGTQRFDDSQFLLLDAAEIKKLGVKVEITKSDLHDDIVNNQHRDIWPTYEQILPLINLMVESNIATFTTVQIVDFVKQELANKNMVKTNVFRDKTNSAEVAKLMINHWKKGILELTHP